jgi:mRNA-degrading endonuclease YafQ of YafQ-DinJ toxin-antitoxin module
MYELRFSAPFQKRYVMLTAKDEKLEKRIRKALHHLSVNPRHPSLKTHKTDTPQYGRSWSSWVIGDLRIQWRYVKGEHAILLLGLGGHSGKHAVYR